MLLNFLKNLWKGPSNVAVKTDNPKIYVVGGGYAYIRFLHELNYKGAACKEEADVVLFTGGEDVTPELYGERPLTKTFSNRSRDDREKEIYDYCVENKIPMVGICRGGQFLNVMNGGKMWQHVNNHTRPHKMFVLEKDTVSDEIEVTSTHHQMMIPTDDAWVLAVAKEATVLLSSGKEITREPKLDDIEVVWYPDTTCLCFQPHPELPEASDKLVEFFDECIQYYVTPYVPRFYNSNSSKDK